MVAWATWMVRGGDFFGLCYQQVYSPNQIK